MVAGRFATGEFARRLVNKLPRGGSIAGSIGGIKTSATTSFVPVIRSFRAPSDLLTSAVPPGILGLLSHPSGRRVACKLPGLRLSPYHTTLGVASAKRVSFRLDFSVDRSVFGFPAKRHEALDIT